MREILFKAKQVGDDESVITIKDFTQHFQKILIIDMSLVSGVKKLMSEETFSTIKNYYRRINNGESNNYN
jgi:phage-related protein